MIKCPVLVTLSLLCLSLLVVLRSNPGSSTIVDGRETGGQPLEKSGCCCQVQAAASEEILPDKSLYQLESSWTRHDNQTISLKQLRGKVQLIAMIFTHCPSSCPRLV